MDAATILRILKEEKIGMLRLSLNDLLGVHKSVEIPAARAEDALSGQIIFDGSSIEGFIREKESDVRLMPDPETFSVVTWEGEQKIGRLVCDLNLPDGAPYPVCTRSILKKMVQGLSDKGLALQIRPEIEFFLFEQKDSLPSTITSDTGGYFDMTPGDPGQKVRREVMDRLIKMGVTIDGMHHEVAYGQHEMDLSFATPLTCADYIAACRFLVRQVAHEKGMHGTFMPKPIFGKNGSGLHLFLKISDTHGQGLVDKKGLTSLGKLVVAGILEHSRGLCALTNPLVNSYKRLVPEHEAPTHVFCSRVNKNPLVRITEDHVEFRLPDPSCNPYLAIAALIGSILDGIEKKPGPYSLIDKDIVKMSGREKARLKVHKLPGNLSDAVDWLEKDKLFVKILGDQAFRHYTRAKRAEWEAYIAQVHPWEVERYLGAY